MNEERSQEIDKNVAAHLEYFAERKNLLFSYFFCVIEFSEDEDFVGDESENSRTWMLKSIQNACLHASLIALRDLDDFFTLRTNNSDDLKASDFGIGNKLSFLSKDERIRINKLIAHTTKHGAANAGYRWDLLELVSKAAAQCDTFLEWVKENYSRSAYFYTWTAAAATQAITKSTLKAIQQRSPRKV